MWGGEGKGEGLIKVGKGEEMWEAKEEWREKLRKGGREDGDKRLAKIAGCHV